MSVRVNLLRESELRHQGVVSRRFTVQATAGAVVLVLIIAVLLGVLHRRNVSRSLADNQALWTGLEPVYDRVRTMQAHLGANQNLVDELNGWNTSRVEWNTVLGELQALVPLSVQLTRLNVRSGFVMLENPNEDGKEVPSTPARQFQVRLDGKAAGARADEVVNQFVTLLTRSPVFQEVLESLKLQGLQRADTPQAEEAQRLFGIEGVTRLRKIE